MNNENGDKLQIYSNENHKEHNQIILPSGEPSDLSLKHECMSPVDLKVPFCCIVPVPKGFELPDKVQFKIGYSMDCLSVVKDHCRKHIQIDDCGPVEIDVNVLKVIGCINMMINLQVTSDCVYYDNYHERPLHEHTIYTCCEENICVNNILKCSTHKLPGYHISCDKVKISDLNYEVNNDNGCTFVIFKGYFEFKSCL